MKRLTLILTLILLATTAFAQEEKKEKPEEQFNTTRDFRNKVFETQHRMPRDLFSSISLLGSGFKGAAISVNNELRTITVRDFPENIAAIEEALRRLDRPVDARPDIELKISVLIASKSALASASTVPDELTPVLKQLQATLRYTHYGLMAATVTRTTRGRGVDGSGVADATLLGLTANQERPIFYRYKLSDINTTASQERRVIDVGHFEFSMNVPVGTGSNVQYQSVGFETPVSIRENEKVVIGTTTMGEKALIVVMMASSGK